MAKLPRGQERMAESDTGGKKGVKPERYSFIPVPFLDVLARQYSFGAGKYDDHNWRKGYPWSSSYDALMRHATAWWDGEDLDPESGLTHLAAAGFHVASLTTFESNPTKYGRFDDRYKGESD